MIFSDRNNEPIDFKISPAKSSRSMQKSIDKISNTTITYQDANN